MLLMSFYSFLRKRKKPWVSKTARWISSIPSSGNGSRKGWERQRTSSHGMAGDRPGEARPGDRPHGQRKNPHGISLGDQPIDRRRLGSGQTRVLYVSPLKALNNDIRRNLTAPLEELKSYFRAAGVDFPEICVLTRSGDTPAKNDAGW